MILELGGNDGLRGLPVDVTRDNLSFMIESSQELGADVVLSEIRIPPNYGRSYTEQFNANYQTLTEQYGIVLLPFLLQDIALDENLMLKNMPGIFCAGEMLDWEAPTGGYLLTGCFTTGRAAGLGVLNWLKG